MVKIRIAQRPDLPGTHRNGGRCLPATEDAMAKELEMNDNTAQNQERQPRQQSSVKRYELKPQGNAFQVYEYSVEDQDHSPAPPQQQSGDKGNQNKPQGKAFQVNENSIEDQDPARSPVPPRRG
jgi:hypothetical protein